MSSEKPPIAAMDSLLYQPTPNIRKKDIEGHACSDSGERRLAALGYRQELQRTFGLLTSAASAFAVNSYMMSLTGTMPLAYSYGGPVPAVYGWLLVAAFNMTVVLSMAELASSYPLAGGPYFWCVELTRNDPAYTLVAWCTAWLNVLGQFAATSGAASLMAQHVAAMWVMQNGYVFQQRELFLVYALCLLAAGLVSSVGTRGTQAFILSAAGFLVAGGLFLMFYLPAVAPVHRSTLWVFTGLMTEGKQELSLPDNTYVFLMGLLLSQFSFIGSEAPSQFAEETREADSTVPKGFVIGAAMTSVMGFGYTLVLFYCIQEGALTDILDDEAHGYAVGQIFFDIMKARFGDGRGAVILMAIPLIAIFNTVVMCMLTSARMLWSFSRDGGVCMYRVWASVNPRTRTPVNAVWAMTALAFLLGLPMLWSSTAFEVIGSMSAAGLFISYTVPICLRLALAGNFEPGPFRLHPWARPAINGIAVLYMTLIMVLCIIPGSFPVSIRNLNWTVVLIGFVLALCLLAWYFPRWGARRWYRGKAHTLPNANVRGGGRYGLDGRANYGRVGRIKGAQVRLTLLEVMEAQRDSLDPAGLLPSKHSLEFSTKPRSLLAGPGNAALPPLPGRARSPLSAPRLPRIEDSAEEARTPS